MRALGPDPWPWHFVHLWASVNNRFCLVTQRTRTHTHTHRPETQVLQNIYYIGSTLIHSIVFFHEKQNKTKTGGHAPLTWFHNHERVKMSNLKSQRPDAIRSPFQFDTRGPRLMTHPPQSTLEHFYEPHCGWRFWWTFDEIRKSPLRAAGVVPRLQHCSSRGGLRHPPACGLRPAPAAFHLILQSFEFKCY